MAPALANKVLIEVAICSIMWVVTRCPKDNDVNRLVGEVWLDGVVWLFVYGCSRLFDRPRLSRIAFDVGTAERQNQYRQWPGVFRHFTTPAFWSSVENHTTKRSPHSTNRKSHAEKPIAARLEPGGPISAGKMPVDQSQRARCPRTNRSAANQTAHCSLPTGRRNSQILASRSRSSHRRWCRP
jgi:hypothetical protein